MLFLLRMVRIQRFAIELAPSHCGRFTAEDWALQCAAPDTLPTILTLGAQPYDYEVWLAGIGFRYLIGNSTK